MVDSLMEDLAKSECRALLKTNHFGRVAFTEKAGGPPQLVTRRRINVADLPSNWWG
jgi:hypothetical protein